MSRHLFHFIVIIFVVSVSAQMYFQTSTAVDCSGTKTCYRIASCTHNGCNTICAPWSSTSGKETLSASINTNYGKLNFRSSSCGFQSETDQSDGTWDQCAATDFFDTGGSIKMSKSVQTDCTNYKDLSASTDEGGTTVASLPWPTPAPTTPPTAPSAAPTSAAPTHTASTVAPTGTPAPSPNAGVSCASAVTTWTGFDVDCTSVNGDCSAIVDFTTTGGTQDQPYTCNDYCTAIGKHCWNAWEDAQEPVRNTCSTGTVVGCDGNYGYGGLSTSDGICQCGDSAQSSSSTGNSASKAETVTFGSHVLIIMACVLVLKNQLH